MIMIMVIKLKAIYFFKRNNNNDNNNSNNNFIIHSLDCIQFIRMAHKQKWMSLRRIEARKVSIAC